MSQAWKLSPSDLTFLWDSCPRCFYLKVVRGLDRPWSPLPRIFSQIDSLITGFFQDRSTAEITPALPLGTVRYGQKWLTSQEIALPGHESKCYIKGRFDSVVEFDDGSYGIIDYKTSRPSPQHLDFYSRQLHAYAYALEHPAQGKFSLAPVSRMGLLVFEPSAIDWGRGMQLSYQGELTWLECAKDYDGFLAFVDGVLAALEAPGGPPSNPECGWCQYREAARSSGW
jgi:hypothetical protein